MEAEKTLGYVSEIYGLLGLCKAQHHTRSARHPQNGDSKQTNQCLEGSLAQRASRFVGRREPLVEAGAVELVPAGLARQPRQAVVARGITVHSTYSILSVGKHLDLCLIPRRVCGP
jgi:hypothetical protein